MSDEVTDARQAIAAALAAIRRNPRAQERIEDAGQLAAVLADARRKAAAIRREAVIEIYEAGKYSLKGLADRLGKSKQWAAQIIPADHPQRRERRTRAPKG